MKIHENSVCHQSWQLNLNLPEMPRCFFGVLPFGVHERSPLSRLCQQPLIPSVAFLHHHPIGLDRLARLDTSYPHDLGARLTKFEVTHCDHKHVVQQHDRVVAWSRDCCNRKLPCFSTTKLWLTLSATGDSAPLSSALKPVGLNSTFWSFGWWRLGWSTPPKVSLKAKSLGEKFDHWISSLVDHHFLWRQPKPTHKKTPWKFNREFSSENLNASQKEQIVFQP